MAMMFQFGRSKSVAKRSKKYLEEVLYKRLFKDGSDEVNVRQKLNEFLKSSKRFYKWEVGVTLKKLRRSDFILPQRFGPAQVLNPFWCCQPERIPALIQEMKAEDIMLDIFTYNVWMRALAAANDVSAEKALKELEKKNACQDLSAYPLLTTLYGKTENLLEVYRVWCSLRLAFPKTANISHLNMVQVLVNLKDITGAEKCFREREAGCSTYDIGAANVLIKAYVEEGAEVFESLIRTYAAAGNTSPVLCRLLKMENIEVSGAVKKLLDTVCTE
ncbi:hypothetical protein RJ641_015508 [Dillenia turbinata]|uniref:Pentatricopeptide repeat-containing protein n=1 Tax=Dillenia turbinata TaxID=194707 RepID=A0AAN8YY94_9MAGN